jgi:predicted nucleic-acid-binding protein
VRGVDTNVLVRYLTDDDPKQSALARELIQGAEDQGERLYINTIVVCELCWTLRGRRYGYDRPTIAAALEKMLDARVFELENRALVARAIGAYRLGRADFADYLIGLANRRAGCEDTVSFDARRETLDEFTVL